MEQSILNSIKKMYGMSEPYESFDTDLIIYINSVFAILNQMGVGPEEIYCIDGPENKWEEFLSDKFILNVTKTYIYLKTKLMFDPPENGTVMNAINEQIKECETRLYTFSGQY